MALPKALGPGLRRDDGSCDIRAIQPRTSQWPTAPVMPTDGDCLHKHPTPPDLPPPPLPAATSRWAMFLDVDGTLLGFNDEPAASVPAASMQATVHDAQRAVDGALALVSGRALVDLDRMFGDAVTAAAGLHGIERRRADGSRDDRLIAGDDVDALRSEARALAFALPGVRVEDKGVCIALHCREAPAQETALRQRVQALVARFPGYMVQSGNRVQELKPAGIDKGDAVTAFMREAPFAGRMPVYLGDDLTDEHAFACVNALNGISVRVGHRTPTCARFTLGNPGMVQAWLNAVVKRLAP